MDGKADNPAGDWDMTARIDDIIAVGKALVEEVTADRMPLDHAFFEMAAFAGRLAYADGQRDLKARFIPVRFTRDSVGFAEMDGEDAERLLKEWGLSGDG